MTRAGSPDKVKHGANTMKVSEPGYRRELHQRRKRDDPEYLKNAATYQREYRQRIRSEIYAAYGGKCYCCEEDTPEFLTIDHIHGGGDAHRRRVGGWFPMLRDIKNRGCPKDEFRLSCFNCNLGRALTVDGRCPHEYARQPPPVL
jgi:hypothetical protein